MSTVVIDASDSRAMNFKLDLLKIVSNCNTLPIEQSYSIESDDGVRLPDQTVESDDTGRTSNNSVR